MRYVTIPEPIMFEDFVTGEPMGVMGPGGIPLFPKGVPITMVKFLDVFVLPDKRLGADAKTAKTAFRLRRAFKGCKPGDVITLDDKDHDLLVEIVESPAQPESGHIIGQLFPYIEALAKKVEEDPNPKLKSMPPAG